MAPFHPPEHNRTQSLEQDLELIRPMDELGFDEAWIGEHQGVYIDGSVTSRTLPPFRRWRSKAATSTR